MTKSWNPERRKRYDRSGAVVLNRVKLGQAPISLHRIRWMHRGLWILLILALMGGGLGLWLTVDARFYVYDAEIVGNRRLSHAEIFAVSGLEGLHILWARSATIEARILEALPSLEDVEASCELPSACSISVVERRPRVLWYEGSAASSELWWIDERGAIFPYRDEAVPSATGVDSQSPSAGRAQGLDDAAGRWEVSGPLPRDGNRAHGYLDKHVLVGLNELWESGRDLPSTFQYAPEHGISFVDEHGWQIIVGRGSGMARRLQVLERLTAHLESRGVTPRLVDVRFPDAPYYVPAADEGASWRGIGYAIGSGCLSNCGLDVRRAPL